jgi:hypothetical protein
MNKIKKMYSIFILYNLQYENAVLPFLDRLYSQWYSKDIGIIKKFLFNRWYCNGILWNLYTKTQENNKFLYF